MPATLAVLDGTVREPDRLEIETALARSAGVVAQATGTATRTASPTAPQTGNAGLIDQSGSLAAAAVLVVLAVSVVAGGRVLSTRRNN